MELLEMELIKKLQNTQAIQKQAYMELEAAIQQKGGGGHEGSSSALYGGPGSNGHGSNSNINNMNGGAGAQDGIATADGVAMD